MELDLQKLLVDGANLAADACAGKVVVITGAGRGIGRQAAWAFALLGGSVVIAELSEQGREVEQEICAAGGRALYVQTDVSCEEDVLRLYEATSKTFGPADILVNNAIRIAVRPVIEMDPGLWDEIIRVNLRGTFLTCRAFLPDMLAQNSGVIINMVSTEAMPGLSAYIASKQAIAGFSQSLALEVGQESVKVIPFGPGMVDTPGIASVASDLAPRLGLTREQFTSVSLHSAYDGFMPPEHAGAATAYLALKLAGEFHGQVVNGYEVLERAGIIQPALAVPPVDALPAPVQQEAHKKETLLQLLDEVSEIIADTECEFGRLPAFVRPIAKSGFKSKSGQSFNDWQHAMASLKSQLEAADRLPADAAAALPGKLEKLIGYYQGVPGETARFTRDQAMLQEISRICSQRISAIRALIEALK